MKTNHPDEIDYQLRSYAFELPEECIAQQPAAERAGSRLMVLGRAGGEPSVDVFSEILRYLPERCLLVANNSRVIPARMQGSRPGGGKAEVLLLTPPPLLTASPAREGAGWSEAEAEALLRPVKKIRPGGIVRIADGLLAELLEAGDFGRCKVRLAWRGDLLRLLEENGSMPLPPYIRRKASENGREGEAGDERQAALDAERYQTTYARADKAGSVAAPTAGLHVTPELRAALAASGREWAEVTLYVGYGTFSPVRCEDIREHPMHAEYVEVPEATAEAIARAKREGRAVIAVGTTSARTLEGALVAQQAEAAGATLPAAHSGWINIFLYPGKPFQVIDGLITNFHLPESSLLMLVSDLAGRERVLAAYREAVGRGFRFFSYGDAMLII